MNKIVTLIIIVFANNPFTSLSHAQGTLYVSNLGQTPTGSAAIGSDAWIGQSFSTFVTEPNSYTLNSIELLMNTASGNPTGFSVSVYNSLGGGQPLSSLGVLAGSDPTVGGLYTYSASGITLLPGNTYYVVVTSQTPSGQAAYNWSNVHLGSAQNGNWNINDTYYSSANGSSWTGNARQDVFQLAIYATPIPEPSVLGLLALGGLCFLWLRRKAKAV